jgi:Mannosyltransferase (PIG-V)
METPLLHEKIGMKPSRITIQLFCYLILFKIVYLGALSAVLLIWPVSKSYDMFPGKNLQTTHGGKLTFPSHFGTWDAEHYLILSDTGYRKGIAQCAFYPLWPLLTRWFSIFTGSNHVISGMILANVFSLAGWLLFFRIVSDRLGESVAKLALIFFVVFPGALFFQFIYSESLFFLLLMLLCFGLEQNRFWLALAAAFLLPLTRAVGVFCIFPILWQLMFRKSSTAGGETLNKQENGPASVVSRFKALTQRGRIALTTGLKEVNCGSRFEGNGVWLPVAPIYGWAFYFFLMWHWTGDPFEGFKAQQQWGNVESIDNLFNPLKFGKEFFTPTCWHGFTGSMLDRSMFVLLVWSLPVIWRLDKGWFLWACVLGIVPAVSGTFTSFTRFESVVFPLFIACAVLMSKPRLRWLRWPTLGAFAILHLILLWRFVNYRWAG